MKYKKNGVVLRMELASDLPRVLGDRVQSQRVILNLVMDGIEAMGGATDRSRELLINPFNMNPPKYSWQCKTPGSGSSLGASIIFSRRSLRQTLKACARSWGSVAPLLRITAGGSGLYRLIAMTQHFNLLFRSTT
jgi:hypothetical protein